MIKLNELNLAFVDSETTGLSEFDHELIELAAIIYDPRKDEVVKEWEVKIRPLHIETASQSALKVNGYINNPGLYSKGLKQSLIKFNSITENCVIVGQNIDFDLRFIKKNMSDFGIEPHFDYRKLDLMSLAWWFVKDTDIPGLSLKKICDYFKVTNVGEHSALIDCRRTFEVYKVLEEQFK